MPSRTFDPDALRQIRLERGLTQVQLAERVGIVHTSVSLMEHGRHKPSVTVLAALADTLGAPMDDFMTRADRELVSA
ncbi:helix-turn-helix transcriptional regulator [Streptomyces sp. NPDC055692]|uniref:helix-turn-helix domain-containing protein n=1 Tax=Streptomyces sp. NPDC055692 TaxID=3155683 RepID=UPI00342CE514